MRTALLAAVSHDLRTPLAGIKAASSALRSTDLGHSDADRAELVETVDESADRLAALVDNLLDMSRLQAGVVAPALEPVGPAGRRRRASPGWTPRSGTGSAWTGPDDLPPCAPTPVCWNASWPTWSATPPGTRPRGPIVRLGRAHRRKGGAPGRRPRTRGSRSPTGSGCSSPSSGWATAPSGRASDSDWPWPAA